MFPFCLRSQHVEGELYEVDDEKLASLDDLEGHPHFYQRLVTKVRTPGLKSSTKTITMDNDNVLECWAYFITSYCREVLDLPRLKSFTNPIHYNISPEERGKRVAKLKSFVKGTPDS
ncbi:gamma-glutamylaminecyclotransferase [Elysia marginata]|uniref:Gamma-glutamylcyclotransferase family protein n=1 Tax=Elysia marginata TaxID=1093978 RepID=A0AAV4GFQ7_9GAST|nr:gamma-glutamylaminecyclotransferase [Elysia marginata]